jgi:hypothetical protein
MPIFNPGEAGVQQITSIDGSVVVVNGGGPTADLSVHDTADGTVTNVHSTNADVGVVNPTTTPDLTVNGINGVNVAGAPAAGQVITAIDATHAHWAAGGGGGARNVPTIQAANYPMVTNDSTVLSDAGAAPRAVTLPAAPGAGFEYNVKKIDATANAVTITGAAGNIDGAPNVTITSQNTSLRFTFDGANWRLI